MDQEYEALVRFGVRSLLGGNTGKANMENLKNIDPAMYDRVMREAQRRYNSLPESWRADPNVGIPRYMASDGHVAELVYDIVVAALSNEKQADDD